VRTVNTYGFAIGEASNIIPIHLFITKARPPMGATLLKESLQSASTGTLEEGLAGVGIIESNFFPSFLHKCGLSSEVSGMFCIYPSLYSNVSGDYREYHREYVSAPAVVFIDLPAECRLKLQMRSAVS
jgi:hypothetical protein